MRARLIREVFSNQNPPLEGDKSMSTTDNAPLTIRDMIEPAIKAAGGWVNTHAHADRAYTLSPDVLEMRRTCTLQQKWDALDRLKRESTEEDFYRRFSRSLRASRRLRPSSTLTRSPKTAPSRPASAPANTTRTSSRSSSPTRRSRA